MKRKFLRKAVMTTVSLAMIGCMSVTAFADETWTSLPFGLSSSFFTSEETIDDLPVVVSLGDSYSAGEGIQPYYGKNNNKYKNEDWISHRSGLAWPGLLKINGTRLATVRATNPLNCSDGLIQTSGVQNGKWYFNAVSGAVTANIASDNKNDRQKKTVKPFFEEAKTYSLNFQIDAITSLANPSDVRYVTLTIGGNDVGFTDIITKAVTQSSYINMSRNGLKQELTKVITQFWVTQDGSEPLAEKLRSTYERILEEAPNAKLIVAGYPKLIHLNEDGTTSSWLISYDEAKLIDSSVNTFDMYIRKIVESEYGLYDKNIAYVDVGDAFDGHEAYSDDQYLEGLVFGWEENVDTSGSGAYISSASFHPNDKGAEAYAGAVQEVFTQYDEDPVLAVFDQDGNACGNYTVKIEGKQYTEQILTSGYSIIEKTNEFSQVLTADRAEPLQLDLDKGDYTITVTDNENPEKSVSKEVKVRKNYDQKEISFTGEWGMEESDLNIPEEAVEWNGHYYYFCHDGKYDWKEASNWCESAGGHLVTITSAEEQDFVYNYVKDLANNEDIWIGLSDADSEGDWSTWVTGEPVSYTNWGKGEPDDNLGAGQDYGVLCNGNRRGAGYSIEAGQWDDIDPSQNIAGMHFICEWDMGNE